MDGRLHPYRLYKKEKLCSVKAVDRLFARDASNSFVAYPLRVVWRVADDRTDATNKFIITVPKKRLHHAVDRVLTRRRIRESYRLNRAFLEANAPFPPVDIAFVYLSDSVKPYSRIEPAMIKALKTISKQMQPADTVKDSDSKITEDNGV